MRDLQEISRKLHVIAGEIEALAFELNSDTDQDIMIDVPYLSQWGVGANKRRGDCGPATVAMCAHYAGQSPTVNEAALACKQPRWGRGSYFTTIYQLRDGGCDGYGIPFKIRAPYKPPVMILDLLKQQVDKGKPSICLICYKTLRELTNPIDGIIHNQDQGYNFGHWVLFVGYSPGGVFIHDSDFWGSRRDDGEFRFIPTEFFTQALATVAKDNSYGSQGLIWEGDDD